MHILCDHGILSTHDSGDTDCLVCITDHQNTVIHCAFLSVQCCKLLILSGASHNDLMTCNCVKIVRMHRLSVLFHHIVGDVDNIVDRTDTVGTKSLLHPLR